MTTLPTSLPSHEAAHAPTPLLDFVRRTRRRVEDALLYIGGITDLAPILGKEIRYSYQVPLSEYVKRHADIMTMAVGLIIHGDQAEQILRDKQADLIAVGREILNNPNWPMDAALKLGVEGPFRNVPPQFGWWLGTRAKRGFGTKPSTWQNGLNETGKVL